MDNDIDMSVNVSCITVGSMVTGMGSLSRVTEAGSAVVIVPLPLPGTAAYGAAKVGLLNLSQTLAVEWAPRVRVNAITAGMIRTEQAHLHYGGDAGIAAVAATVPLGRLGEPQDIADACLFLAA